MLLTTGSIFGDQGIATGTDVGKIFNATWGHLAPKPKKAYNGWFIFIQSPYGMAIEIMDSEFQNLDDSPWLYEDMIDYASSFCDKLANDEIDSDGIYVFEGYYKKGKENVFSNGNFEFVGETRKIDNKSLLRHER